MGWATPTNSSPNINTTMSEEKQQKTKNKGTEKVSKHEKDFPISSLIFSFSPSEDNVLMRGITTLLSDVYGMINKVNNLVAVEKSPTSAFVATNPKYLILNDVYILDNIIYQPNVM